MELFLFALAVIFGGGALALLSGGGARLTAALGAGGAIAGCALGLIPAVSSLVRAERYEWSAPWSAPYGSLSLAIDPLSAVFLIIVFGLSLTAAVYGGGYLAHLGGVRRLGSAWFFYNTLVVSMAVVAAAQNAVLFLVAWETMSLASFFLVMFGHADEETRKAGFVYLAATSLGAAFLFAMFVILAQGAGSLEFSDFSAPGALAGVVFALAVVGFGSKAGLVPFHVWLPVAHPAAPSHVSALMSGAMIKMGVYGLLRTITFLEYPQLWWGLALIGLGALSAVCGALWALGQDDLKKALAYSTVENAGIITMGIGLGALGASQDAPAVAALGFGGALFHAFNHALFKGLLFMNAGAVAHATGTRRMSLLGGLMKKTPVTGSLFIFGGAAICGLPPLNGFISEFLIYLAAFAGAVDGGPVTAGAGLAVIVFMAVTGTLAAALVARAAGAVFLGAARSAAVEAAHEPGPAMLAAMLALAGMMTLTAALAPAVAGLLTAPVVELAASDPAVVEESLRGAADLLRYVVMALGMFVALVFIVALARRSALSGKSVESSVTWDCGYAAPSARMQYTPSSFAQPVSDFFHIILRPRAALAMEDGLFPKRALFTHETDDPVESEFYRRLFAAAARGIGKLQAFRAARANVYIFYTAGALLALLVWGLMLS